LPDENSDSIQKYIHTYARKVRFIVPLLWWYETSNVLTIATRRNRLRRSDADLIIELFDNLNIETEYSHGSSYIKRIIAITQDHAISAYDAVYMELAIRYSATLATADKKLSRIARSADIDIVKI